MRNAFLLVVVGLVLGFLPVASAAPVRSGHIKVVRVVPFIVGGSGFAPGEHVALNVKARSGAIRRIEATSAGTFVMRIVAVKVGSCGWYAVRAVGVLGTVAGTSVLPHCSPSSRIPDEPPPRYSTPSS